jgi:hypothetical protein
MSDPRRVQLDGLLDILVDAVAERLQNRMPVGAPAPPEPAPPEPELFEPTIGETDRLADASLEVDADVTSEPSPEEQPMPIAHSNALVLRLALIVGVIVVLINVPFNMQGMALARSIPSATSLVIRKGLLVKETDSPDIWVYGDAAFHHISSIDVFEFHGYRWRDVRVVQPGFLDQFAKGPPRYVLLNCVGSPHFYRLDANQKRWVVDLATFAAEGYQWQDLKTVSCDYLRNLPDGESIPPGHGLPPSPRP